jgi:hypothetical protein
MEKEQILNDLVSMMPELIKIKANCSNATPQQMSQINQAVRLYNQFVEKRALKSSACSFPDSLRTIRKLLAGHGKIELAKWEKFLK